MSLPHFQLTVGSGADRKLRQNVWSSRFVPAILSDGSGSIPIRIGYRGGHTREYAKKSYELRIKGRTYHLNAEYDDPSLIRNALSFRFFRMIGVPSPHTRHVVLTIDGRNEGVYVLIEAVKRSFFRRRGILMKSLMYASNDRANFSLKDPDTRKRKKTLFAGYDLIIGTGGDREKMKAFIQSLHALKGDRLKVFLEKHVDLDNYLRWLAGAVMTGNYDGFEHNYAIYEHKPTGKYRMIPWDYEGTWGRNCYGKRVSSNLVRITGYNDLTEKVLESKEARQRYKALLKQLTDTAFTKERIMPVVYEMHGHIARDVYKDPGRQNGLSLFRSEPDVIERYIRDRRQDIREGIRLL
ncbi:CotH kinase family protein [Paenibacillus sp. 1P03SA]|uniref:CotH kinase family protein n=1 Tax=Paenibacillus sp. 1P03SA TaxID=3132294 RepID=UPI0039A006C2